MNNNLLKEFMARSNIVVWCKEAENMHEDPDKKVKRVISPCVQNYYQEPPCKEKPCEAILNYLRDYA
jgi:hypothetical protein